MKRIKTGDTVVVIAGKSKTHKGVVKKVLLDKVIVEGAGIIHKHVKPNPNINQQGGILQREAPIHISNVAIYNPTTQKADKVGFKVITDDQGNAKKVRYFKSDNEIIDRN